MEKHYLGQNKGRWYFNRLRSMNLQELVWRLSQKAIEVYEYKHYSNRLILEPIYPIAYKMRGVLKDRDEFIKNEEKPRDYKRINWHACIDTPNNWPKIPSNQISYKQNDAFGDARKNWEINRHFQLQELAYQYWLNGKEEFLDEFSFYLEDWNRENPFLVGISYTSVMESALRGISWIVCSHMIAQTNRNKTKKQILLLKRLRIGIVNLGAYVSKHCSAYSSANNHRIVEMVFLGMAGEYLHLNSWKKRSEKSLIKEMLNQNYSDGVNKEMSIHYHAFVMEAVGLYLLFMKEKDRSYDAVKKILSKMTAFLTDLSDENGNIPELGDNDEGCLLNLNANKTGYYMYVRQLMSLILPVRYSEKKNLYDNLKPFVTTRQLKTYWAKPEYTSSLSKTYPIGGYSILKGLGAHMIMDHGELGYGSIAAHGHADALSITLSLRGEPVLIDSGTYCYHNEKKWRDYFRKTLQHNTVEIEGKDQAEMLGAFLWGKRGKSRLVGYRHLRDKDKVVAEHNGYFPIIHRRILSFDKNNGRICIIDKFKYQPRKTTDMVASFVLHPSIRVSKLKSNSLQLKTLSGRTLVMGCNKNQIWQIEKGWVSLTYGKKEETKVLRIRRQINKDDKQRVVIQW